MVQRSISSCFFGNTVTMAFKLIFVFAVIAVFAVDALRLRACATWTGGYCATSHKYMVTGQNKLQIRQVAFKRDALQGQYRTIVWFNPDNYELNSFGRKSTGRIYGCNYTRWMQSAFTCTKGGWRFFRLKPDIFKDVKFTLRLKRGGTLLACFVNN